MIMTLLENYQSILQKIKPLINIWNSCSYGIPVHGHLRNVPSAEYFDKHWHLLSPQQFLLYHGGICYDFVEYGSYWLNNHNIPHIKYYMYTTTPNEDTHTFIVIPYNGIFIYIEGAFKLLSKEIHGIKIFYNLESIFKLITKNSFRVNDNDTLNSFNYYIWKYSGRPPYGCDALTFTQYCTQSEPVYEGVAYNISKRD